jgi:Family of unknown function (DUF5335)
MARTRDIPREQWANFFTMLARELQDHPIRIEVEGRELGDQEMDRMLPLVDIAFEKKGSEAGDIEVTVTTGSKTDTHGHFVDKPNQVYVMESDAGEVECIAIEAGENEKTLIYFEEAPSLGARISEQSAQSAPPS